MSDSPKLMIPGPVAVNPQILAAMSEPTLAHYGDTFLTLLYDIYGKLERLLHTKNDIFIVPGAGTLSLDMATMNLVPAGASYVVIDNGWFGERWEKIVRMNAIHPYMIRFPWGKHIDFEVVADKIQELMPLAEKEGRPIKGMAVVHHDTSVGILNSLEEMTRVSKEFDLPLIVDAVASFGGMHIPVDELGVDVLVGTPNKALGTPPGLGIMTMSKRALQAAYDNPSPRGWYLDVRTWMEFRKEWKHHPYPSTLPTNNMVALNKALDMFFEVGPEAHYGRISSAAEHVRSELGKLGFEVFPEASYRAPMVSVFSAPEGVDIPDMLKYLLSEHNIMVGNGIGVLAGKVFRIGHMGDSNRPENVEGLLNAIRQYVSRKN